MSIKFRCPVCKKALSVKDELAGKKGTCPGCKKVLVVPAAPATQAGNGRASNGVAAKAPAKGPAPQTPLSDAEIEAAAAAVFSDKPAGSLPAASQNIEFTCPMCDEPLHLPLELAGKNTPCPGCRRIIKVPLPKQPEKIEWKKPGAGVPSLARQDVPAVEGVWDNKETSHVSQEALEEAGALPELREPLTAGQWAQRILVVGAAVAFFVAGVAFVSHRARQERETHSLDEALRYLQSDASAKDLGPVGRAELNREVGLYLLRSGQENSAAAAQGHFDAAFDLLRDSKGRERDTERDLALAALAVARVDLGGAGDDVDEGRRLAWKETRYGNVQKMIGASLGAVHSRELRLEAFRQVARRVAAAGEPSRVFALANQAFGTAASNHAEQVFAMEAKGVAGVELLAAGEQAEAGRIAKLLQQEYSRPNRPPLASSAVALTVALGQPELKAGKIGTDGDNETAGKAEGLARHGDTSGARKLLEKAHPQLKMRAQLGMAAAALDGKAEDLSDLVEAFHQEANCRATGVPLSQWVQWRLLQLGLRAAAANHPQQAAVEECVKQLLEVLPDPVLRARGRLALFESQLAKSDKPEADDAVEVVPEKTVSRALAHEALARHNVRHDKGAARKVQEWPQPCAAFGSVGVARALQGE